MAQLTVTGNEDYRDGTPPLPADVDSILFDTPGPFTATATFGSNQFNPGPIATSVSVIGDPFPNSLVVRLSATGTFSASTWSFTTWSANDRVLLVGTTGQDTLTGSARNDVLEGGNDADTLNGGGGDDVFFYNDPDDLFSSDTADETINGGTHTAGGGDAIRLATAGEYALGANVITGVEILIMAATDQTARFDANVQLGAGAITTVQGQQSFTQTVLAIGNDVDLSGVTFQGWGGANQSIDINGSSNVQNILVGSNQRETFNGNTTSFDDMTGRGGADILNGNGGIDFFIYLAPSDIVAGEEINGGTEGDRIVVRANGTFDFRPATITSIESLHFDLPGLLTTTAIFSRAQFGAGLISSNLSVIGDVGSSQQLDILMPSASVFSAGGWTFSDFDTVKDSDGFDSVRIFGSDGDDNITGSSVIDTIFGGNGVDSINAGANDDRIFVENDDVVAGEFMTGGAHVNFDELVAFGTGNIDLSVATILGIERLSFQFPSPDMTITLRNTQIGASAINVVSSGGNGTNDLVVNGGSADLSGVIFASWEPGNSITINGTAAPFETLVGSNQADTINGGGGTDTMRGGAGNDRILVDSAGDRALEIAGEGSDTVIASTSFTLEAGSEIELLRTLGSGSTAVINLTGNEFQQTLQGNAVGNTLNGGGDRDTMQGFAGDDTYFVNHTGDVATEATDNGSDRAIVTTSISYTLQANSHVELLRTTGSASTYNVNLHGNNLINTVQGNNATNVLSGGGGSDTMTGFGGVDTFRFNTALGAANIDTVTDYNVANDTIQVDNAVFTGLANGPLAAGAFRIGAAAADGDDRIIYNNLTGALISDSNGNAGGGINQQFATLAAGLALTNADFVVI